MVVTVVTFITLHNYNTILLSIFIINSRRQWRTGKPGVLHSMGLQRIGHDWATEQTNGNSAQRAGVVFFSGPQFPLCKTTESGYKSSSLNIYEPLFFVLYDRYVVSLDVLSVHLWVVLLLSSRWSSGHFPSEDISLVIASASAVNLSHNRLRACSVTQSCPTLYDPMDYSPPGSSVHGFSRQEY